MAADNSNTNTGEDYAYDGTGRLTRYGDYTLTQTPQPCGYDPSYGWDCGGAGSSKTYSTQEFYTYDKVGNRTDLNAQIAAGNRLIKFNGDSLVYDDEGNLLPLSEMSEEARRALTALEAEETQLGKLRGRIAGGGSSSDSNR